MSDDKLQHRAELEQLQGELETRQSITCYSKAIVACVVALILGGGTLKLFIDSARAPYVAWIGSLLVLGLFTFAVVQTLRGRKAMRDEDVRYRRMMELRQLLNLDDPSALLPG